MKFRRFVITIWLAFVLRGTIHALMAPMWDGFDEPFHLAYVVFVADHGRPPGFTEPSFPKLILDLNRLLPSAVKYGAPSFEEWRKFTDAERARRRAVMQAAGLRWQEYMSPNYERQQAPVYYYLMAPVALLFRNASLPGMLIALRIASVLLASLVIPISARMLRSVLPRRAAVIALPLIAFLPNTPFFVFRVSNEAAAWPIFALSCLAITTAAPFTPVALLAGVWTKLTLLCTWPAAAIEAVRLRRPLQMLAIPIAGGAVLAVWTKVSSGTWTGLAEATNRKTASAADWLHGLGAVFSFDWWRRLIEMHVWSGGWGFVQPPRWLVDGVIVAMIVLVVALFLMPSRRRLPRRRGLKLLAIVAVTMVAAMIYHGITGAIAARQTPGFPAIGAEGWYLDLIRPVEAALFAALLFTRVKNLRIALLLCFFLPVLADAAGALFLMIPHWGGWQTFDFSPLAVPPLVYAVLAAGYLASAFAAARAKAT